MFKNFHGLNKMFFLAISKNLANSRPSASNFKISRSLEHFFSQYIRTSLKTKYHCNVVQYKVQTWVFKCKAIFSFKYYKMLADNKACFRAIKYGGYIKKNILCNAVLNSCLGNKYPKHLLSGLKFVSIKDQICWRFIGFSLGKDSLISKCIISTY